MQIQNKLNTMVGRHYMLDGRVHKIVGWMIIDDANCVIIGTDKELRKLDFENIKDALAEYLPVSEENIMKREDTTPVVSLIKTLQDNIELLKQDSGYVKQANAINGAVGQIGNLLKMKLRYEKGMK